LPNCNEHVAKQNISRPTRPRPARFARRSQLEELKWQNHLTLSFRIKRTRH
jgi:hypothetical protein